MTAYISPPSTLPVNSQVWAYLRDSGGPTQDRSVGQQKLEIETYCAQHHLTLSLVFADEAKSGGDTASRDQFNEMMDMSVHQSTRPQGLLLWNYARFARDLDDAQYYKATLRKRGIVIHSLTDPIPEGPYGRVVEVIIDIANEEKKRQTSRDAQRGLRQLVQQHGCVPGIPPTGFKREQVVIGQRRDGSIRTANRWIPDPEYIPRIQQAFAMRAAGSSLADINQATRLFGSLNSYRTFWNNKIYLGILEYSDLVIENYCAPMVELATWQAVQAISQKYAGHKHMQSETDHPRRVASSFLLSGLIRCARCGSGLWAHTTKKKNDIECYRCTQRARRRDCDLPTLPAYALEQGIIRELREYLLTPGSYAETYRAVQRRQQLRQAEHDQERKDLQKDLTTLHRKIDNITEAISEDGKSEALLRALKSLESQEKKLKQDMADAKKKNEYTLPDFSDDQLNERAEQLADKLLSNDFQTRRQVLQGLVHHIRMDRQNNQLIGEIVIYIDDDPGQSATPGDGPHLPISSPSMPSPLADGMSKASSPVGAPLYRHCISFEVQVFRKPRSKK